jgi:type I restriction enzyme S subunit
VPFYKVGDISEAWKRNELTLNKANHYVSLEEAKQLRAKLLPQNTTVFAKIGAAIALNRRAMLSVPSLVDNNVMGLHPRVANLDPGFLFYFTWTLRLNEFSQATTVPSVRKSQIESIALPLPPFPEQRRIVAEIEKQFTRLAAAVAALKRLQANLKRYRASVLKGACEGRLVPTEAELARAEGRDYEPADKLLARILKERRARWEADQLAKMQAARKPPMDDEWKGKYREPAEPDMPNLVKPPDGWCTASLEQLTSAVRVICYGILMPKENIAGGVPYVRVVDMKQEKIALTQLRRTSREIASAYARASLARGDLLLAIRGTFGRVAEVPPELDGGNITQDTARLDVTELVGHRYVALCLRSRTIQDYFKRVARGVAVKGVNIAEVRTCPVMFPALTEQLRIVAEVERRLAVIEELESLIEANLKRGERLRQAILKRAFEGKLVPQDPSDEPASVLLERISTDRAARQVTEKSALKPTSKRRKTVAPEAGSLFQ